MFSCDAQAHLYVIQAMLVHRRHVEDGVVLLQKYVANVPYGVRIQATEDTYVAGVRRSADLAAIEQEFICVDFERCAAPVWPELKLNENIFSRTVTVIIPVAERAGGRAGKTWKEELKLLPYRRPIRLRDIYERQTWLQQRLGRYLRYTAVSDCQIIQIHGPALGIHTSYQVQRVARFDSVFIIAAKFDQRRVSWKQRGIYRDHIVLYIPSGFELDHEILRLIVIIICIWSNSQIAVSLQSPSTSCRLSSKKINSLLSWVHKRFAIAMANL